MGLSDISTRMVTPMQTVIDVWLSEPQQIVHDEWTPVDFDTSKMDTRCEYDGPTLSPDHPALYNVRSQVAVDGPGTADHCTARLVNVDTGDVLSKQDGIVPGHRHEPDAYMAVGRTVVLKPKYDYAVEVINRHSTDTVVPGDGTTYFSAMRIEE